MKSGCRWYILVLLLFVLGTHYRAVGQPPRNMEHSKNGQNLAMRDVPRMVLYHTQPTHLWNRLHAALFVRTWTEGISYGHDRLDPLLWKDSDYLLDGKRAELVHMVLGELIENQGELLITDPRSRAVLQRDLWLVAYWLQIHGKDGGQKLLDKLVTAMSRVALTKEQINTLPNNYQQTVQARCYPPHFNPRQPRKAYLPADLFQDEGDWVCIGRANGPTAPAHLEGALSMNRSIFLIFLKLPGGRKATLELLKKIGNFSIPIYVRNPDASSQKQYTLLPNPHLPQWPQWPKGTEIALVRRAVLLDSAGYPTPSALAESVQLRVMRADTAPPRWRPSDNGKVA